MTQTDASGYHEPVMVAETLRYLDPQPGETMLDATLGGGGHSAALAQRLQPGGTLIGLDRDAEAIAAASARLKAVDRVSSPTRDEAQQRHLSIILIRSDFGKMEAALRATPETKDVLLDGVLFDLGVSSHQLDTARGFSFRRDEPLNMRMDVSTGRSAADLLRQASEPEIARILWEYGEERFSKRIAHAIVARRDRGEPPETTGQLAAIVEQSIPRAAWPKDIHPATRTFQALRIAVNDELGQLRSGLEQAVGRLNAGGRIVVISYHSLEDRIVKQAFAAWAGKLPSAPGSSPAAFLPMPKRTAPTLRLPARKPVTPSQEEIARNPRARSAKLRAAAREQHS